MPRTEPFEAHTDRYEAWFDENESTYRSEIRALERVVDLETFGVEIGVGTGQFAVPLGIDVGVDPALEMLREAVTKDIAVVRGVAEALPFRDDQFEVALIVTTICFVDDVTTTLEEAARVLEPGGRVALGYIDRDSTYGRHYQEIKDENPFYRNATFVSTEELLDELESVGYTDVETYQTVFSPPGEDAGIEEVRRGYGDGSFVALAATVPE